MAGITAVAEQRAEADPEPGAGGQAPGPPRRPRGPLRDGGRVLRGPGRLQRQVGRATADGFAAKAGRHAKAEPFHFQATDLGRYLLFAGDEVFVARGGDPVTGEDAVVADPARASPPTGWSGAAGAAFTLPSEGRHGPAAPPRGRPGRHAAAGREARPVQDPHRQPRHRRWLCEVARGVREHEGADLPRCLADPGDPWLRRRAHPRHGLRVPRRRGALRPALVAVRRHRRAGGLSRPPAQRLRLASWRPRCPAGPTTTRSAGRRSRTGRRRTR